MCAKRTCPFPPLFVALSLRSVVVPVFVDVTTDSHVHLFFFCGMWWTAQVFLVVRGGTFLSSLWRKLWRLLVWIGCHFAFVPTESLLLGFRRVPLLIYVCFSYLFFLLLQGSILRSDPSSLGETLGPEPRFLELASRRSDRIPGFSHLAGSRNSLAFATVSWFLENGVSPSRQFSLSRLQAQVRRRLIFIETLEIAVIFAIVYALRSC